LLRQAQEEAERKRQAEEERILKAAQEEEARRQAEELKHLEADPLNIKKISIVLDMGRILASNSELLDSSDENPYVQILIEHSRILSEAYSSSV
jgi:hypothetical protein